MRQRKTWTIEDGLGCWRFYPPGNEGAFVLLGTFTRKQARAVLDLVKDVDEFGRWSKAQELRQALGVRGSRE